MGDMLDGWSKSLTPIWGKAELVTQELGTGSATLIYSLETPHREDPMWIALRCRVETATEN
jgi:hypothetical protein